MPAALKPPPAKPEKSAYVAEVGQTDATMPWFVHCSDEENGTKAFVPRQKCWVTPLVNGARSFGQLEQAILQATVAIDYITWGFDPMMRLSDRGRTIGEILLQKAEKIPVRILVWYAGSVRSAIYIDADGGLTDQGKSHTTFNLPGYSVLKGERGKYPDQAAWYDKIGKYPNLQFQTRALNNGDVSGAIPRNKDITQPTGVLKQGLEKCASHHQKMVLIDYAQPDRARGFVMGSNTLPRYWDTDDHAIHHDNRYMDETTYITTTPPVDPTATYGDYTPPPTVEVRKNRVYLQPWQDVSSEVGGEILYDLNVNFSRAWLRAEGAALEMGRDKLKPVDFAPRDGSGWPAQIIRTQPQEDATVTISHSHFQNVKNARQYLYFENQYFRLPELVQEMAKATKNLVAAGWPNKLYVFVVGNVPDEHGRMGTFQMLGALGKTEQMPQVQADPSARKLGQAPSAAAIGGDNAALQSVICTLTASDSKRCLPIYTHSKVLIIDDHYYIVSSANLNRRSMASDTEIGVSVPHPAGAKALREKLWGDHRQTALERNFEKEFGVWEKVAKNNLRDFQKNNGPLQGRLTLFWDKHKTPTGAIIYD